MAIIYPLAVPDVTHIRSITVIPEVKVGMTESQFTFEQQTYEWQAERWAFEVQLIPLFGRDLSEPWITFLLKLKGRKGTFSMGNPVGATPRGNAGGSPVVMGADQTGDDIITDGWTALTANILRAGDYIQIGNNLHKVLDDVTSDSGGIATLTIWPPVHTAYADNAPITTSSAKGLFRLTQNLMPYDIEVGLIYGLTFSCIQAQ